LDNREKTEYLGVRERFESERNDAKESLDRVFRQFAKIHQCIVMHLEI